MSAHRATVGWRLGDGEDFLKRRYSRVHTLGFEGGAEVKGSPATAIVPAPWSAVDGVDPESAFTAALSACHMLWFLDHAARAGFVVASYVDEAEGTLGRNGAGKLAMTRVVLRPAIEFSGDKRPTPEDLDRLHHAAHADCFIANSVTTEVVVEDR
ncbi:MAG TPA: OsmC family protein [Caulobacteraceae bacterium]|jgi:organic hydroperoxide reductase OsmC/OhrA|nr:OsmC family protein [Caulobacteraceae bacterium]